MNGGYNDVHRGLLQLVMSRGNISEDSANNALAKLFAVCKYNVNFPKMLIYMIRTPYRQLWHSKRRRSAVYYR